MVKTLALPAISQNVLSTRFQVLAVSLCDSFQILIVIPFILFFATNDEFHLSLQRGRFCI
jgi:hypothetical protein